MINRLVLRFVFVLGILCLCSALYSTGDPTELLTSKSFDEFISRPGVKIVKFYASWCGHCEAFAPKFKKAADILKGVVSFGVVDAEKEGDLSSRFNVEGFPTVLIFQGDDVKQKPREFPGPRDVEALVNFLMTKVHHLVRDRGKNLGFKLEYTTRKSDQSCGDGDSGSGNRNQKQQQQHGEQDSGDAAITLTDENFSKLVLESEDDWLVQFFAPWCGHCQRLAPEWASAAKQLKGKVKLGALDATVHKDMAQRYGIQGFPTIKYFPAGRKSGSAEDYNGGREAASIVAWALDKASLNKPPPEVEELTSDAIFHDGCDNKQLCIVGFLPHLIDCQSKCRKAHIATLKKIAEKNKSKDWGWMWSQARSHKDLEKALQIGDFGYPALVAINLRKEKCAVMRGSFSADGIRDFLHDLTLGRGAVSLTPIKNLPNLKTVKAWDGKDAKVVQAREIDLSELDMKSEL